MFDDWRTNNSWTISHQNEGRGDDAISSWNKNSGQENESYEMRNERDGEREWQIDGCMERSSKLFLPPPPLPSPLSLSSTSLATVENERMKNILTKRYYVKTKRWKSMLCFTSISQCAENSKIIDNNNNNCCFCSSLRNVWCFFSSSLLFNVYLLIARFSIYNLIFRLTFTNR